MASTNKTTNYELSQFIGTDKPTFLGDYNGDMLKIDTQMKANADNVTTANNNASSAVSTANTANTNASSALNSATSATTTANTANNTANTALAKANANEQAIANINLSTFTPITTFNKDGSGTITAGSQINTAVNTDGSLAKIYGMITINNITNSNASKGKITFSTSLRPTDNITIVGGTIVANISGGNVVSIYNREFTIKTNGDVEFEYNYTNNSGESFRIVFINSLIYVKDFGDTPVEE